MKIVIQALLNCKNQFCQGIAQNIEDGDWYMVTRKAGLAFVVGSVAFVILLLLLALVYNILRSIFGKIIMTVVGTPLLLYVMLLSYKMNREDDLAARQRQNDAEDLETWAEGIYEYVRDAMVLVFRAVADYTNVVRPSSPSAIEIPGEPYTIEDGYVVFNFFDKVYGDVNAKQLKSDCQRTLRQMHRAGELNGFSKDLVKVGDAYYCPLQILGTPQDYGDGIQVSVVFATEKTVEVARAHCQLNLDNVACVRRKRRTASKPTDDEV